MQVRCPHCDGVESYAEDVAWRKIPCKSCNRGFTATTKLIVSRDVAVRGPEGRPAPGAGLAPRAATLLVIGALAVGNVLLANAWLNAERGPVETGRQGGPEEGEGQAPESGTDGARAEKVLTPGSARSELAGREGARKGSAREAGAGEGGASEAERADDGKILLEFQRALIADIEGKLAAAKRALERSESSLAREKKAHRGTKGKLEKLHKENARLRREIDRYESEIGNLERRLERGR